AIDDDELAWLENVIPIGKGALQVVNGPGATVATVSGAATIWGVNIGGTPLLIVIATDGSIKQVNTGGTVTSVAPAGSTDATAYVTPWRSDRVLILGSTKGLATWDGATYSVIDATKTGTALAVFEGRVWIAIGRTLTFTAPNTHNDFTAANGAGTYVITDE